MAFAHTAEVIRAEAALKAAGFPVRVMGPPPDMRTGCDMVVEFELMREPSARRVLAEARLAPLAVAPVRAGMLEPVSLFQSVDFGQWLMVRAANMKVTVDKETRVIVNVSGGGCPDVPALAELMVGRTLEDAPAPLERGQTLCSYALELAFREAQRLLPLDAGSAS
ncbi:MAG: DUF3343 domain-containing protein [Desulfovibrio sp.]|nr:DUF3343 domain-containing protein [Desulfovibrio sp.]